MVSFLRFADDKTFLASSENYLKKALKEQAGFCQKYYSTINRNKTKTMSCQTINRIHWAVRSVIAPSAKSKAYPGIIINKDKRCVMKIKSKTIQTKNAFVKIRNLFLCFNNLKNRGEKASNKSIVKSRVWNGMVEKLGCWTKTFMKILICSIGKKWWEFLKKNKKPTIQVRRWNMTGLVPRHEYDITHII